MARGNNNKPAESTESLIDVEVTQETLDLNPELVDEGLQVGETIQVSSEIDLEAEYVIASPFRDKDDYSLEYKEGDPANFDADRTAYLLELGLIKIAE